MKSPFVKTSLIQSNIEGISSTRSGTHAVYMFSYFKKSYNLEDSDFISSFAAKNCSISIPLFHGMREVEQEYVVEKIRNLHS